MATVTSMKKADNYVFVSPEKVKIGKQVRHFDHTDDEIMAKVTSYENDGGQITPVLARKIKDTLEVYDGICRTKAALKFNELHPDKPMLLKVIISNDNADDAYIKAIKSNDERKAMSFVDRAFQMKYLREEKGWSDKEIVEFFNSNASFVSRAKKITGLRASILEAVHKGEVTFDTACDLSDLDDVAQDEVMIWAEKDIADSKARYAEELGKQIAAADHKAESNGAVSDDAVPAGFGDTPAAPAKAPSNGKRTGAARPPKAPTKPTTPNVAVAGAIARKRAGDAEEGKGDGKLTPPTLAHIKEVILNEFSTKSCPPKMKVAGGHLMSWLTGKDKMTDGKLVKTLKELLKD